MPYRDEDEVLRERYRTLEGELSHMKDSREVLAGLDAREATLREEMATLTRAIARTRRRAGTPLLANLSVASPCPARWDDMVGDERTRFCGGCRKSVHNLSALDTAAAEALLASSSGELCVRYFQRSDGTVMTQDCPDGVRRKKSRKLLVIAGAFGLAATALGTGATLLSTGARQVTGAVAVQGEAMQVMGGLAPLDPGAPTSTAGTVEPSPGPVLGTEPAPAPQPHPPHTMGRISTHSRVPPAH